MSEIINTNTGEQTNVKSEAIIDYRPLDTVTRDDDNVWNVMQYMGKTDEEEAEQGSARVELDSEAEIFKRRRVGRVAILNTIRSAA